MKWYGAAIRVILKVVGILFVLVCFLFMVGWIQKDAEGNYRKCQETQTEDECYKTWGKFI